MVFKTADVGKAAVLGFGKKRSMMELQNLQEALKVEIQIHQKLVSQMKQDPQKKVVEQLRRDLLVKQEDMKLQTLQADGQTSTLLITQTQTPLPAASLTTPQSSVAPVIASKTLPLVLRAATPTSIIMTPAPTITVVTTLGSTLLASPPSSDPQKSPVNFQPVIQTTNQGAEPVRVIPNSTVVVQAASQPIKVPQFVRPTRQTTRPATLPQVRPKPPVSLSPAAGQVSVHTLQSPVLLSTALPSSGHVQQMRILNGLPCPNSSNNTSILISPSTHTLPSAQTHTQQLPHNSPSSDNTIRAVEYGTEPKTSLLISPDTPTHTSPPLSLDAPSSPAPTNTHTPSSKHQESPLKLAFMLSLGLVTRNYLEEIQSRRQERKRRTTANPIYSGAMFEPERKKSSVSYLSSINQSSRKRANEDSLSEVCYTNVMSSFSFSFLLCFVFCLSFVSSHPGRLSKNCSIVERGPLPPTTSSHHSSSPDLQRPTAGSPFSPALSLTLPSHSSSPSPSSAGDILQKEDAIEWPGTLAIVHSYISYKAAKEGEKDRLKRWSTELRQERETLEHRIGQLSNSITRCMDSKNSVLAQQREMEASLEKMRGLVHLIKGIQLSPFICPGAMANGETSHNGASKPSSSSAVTTDTNNNTNAPTSSSEATVIISTLTNMSDTLKQIATNNNPEAACAKSDECSEESAQMNSTSRIKSEPTNANAVVFSNSSSNQAVLSTNGTVSTGEENTKKHKNNSDLSVIPQALLGSIVPLTEVTEGVK
ncbi:PHD finger protein 21A-like isoform X2 [Sinocyclocheilus grahami]|uniref:PHD finger protein 21A-like isoform X2 n=1 Tax=Sinocyclocheilus grahami TaxID=75366 RepID=UPI0007AD312F|nr:PREDICTED: PHD finger protein 21A-like isoform X2 [Sinocyclocheilus grahami]